MTGSWEVNVTNAMPEKVATAMGTLGESLLGAEYTPIAYLGYQVVNGINYAVLAEQLLTTGKDTKNIVVIIFNEKPGAMTLDLVAIERVLQGGAELGGVKIDVEYGDAINATAKKVFDDCFTGFVGSIVEPFALLGTQVTDGIDYIFACEMTPLTTPGTAQKKVVLVRVSEGKSPVFTDLISDSSVGLRYSFTCK